FTITGIPSKQSGKASAQDLGRQQSSLNENLSQGCLRLPGELKPELIKQLGGTRRIRRGVGERCLKSSLGRGIQRARAGFMIEVIRASNCPRGEDAGGRCLAESRQDHGK